MTYETSINGHNGQENVSDVSDKLASVSLTPSSNSSVIEQEQKITPWDVQGEVGVGGISLGINYGKLMNQFGCQPLTTELLARFKRVIGNRPIHPFLRRGLFYCHRDLERILDLHEQGKAFYLYTGRGPSSDSMHLGHMIPFVLCQWLQEVFGCFLVIQLTDDEKFLFKEQLTLEQCQGYARDNAKDIIAVGFNPEKTFIFQNTSYMGHMFETVLKVQKMINLNQAQHVFGFTGESAIGQISFPASQIAPAFYITFPQLFKKQADMEKEKNVASIKDKTLKKEDHLIQCLIPYAIDQDPYFRLCRDIAPRLGMPKPASLCSVFFPSLQGFNTKMSSSTNIQSTANDPNSIATGQPVTAIFMTDTPKQIMEKINRHAFSGGRDTIAEHRAHGANLAVDIPFQYLKFFLNSDEELEHIAQSYGKGEMLTGEVKKRCIEVLQEFVATFQERRRGVTDKVLDQFMRVHRD